MFYNCSNIKYVDMSGITEVIYVDGFTGIFNYSDTNREL